MLTQIVDSKGNVNILNMVPVESVYPQDIYFGNMHMQTDKSRDIWVGD